MNISLDHNTGNVIFQYIFGGEGHLSFFDKKQYHISTCVFIGTKNIIFIDHTENVFFLEDCLLPSTQKINHIFGKKKFHLSR